LGSGQAWMKYRWISLGEPSQVLDGSLLRDVAEDGFGAARLNRSIRKRLEPRRSSFSPDALPPNHDDFSSNLKQIWRMDSDALFPLQRNVSFTESIRKSKFSGLHFPHTCFILFNRFVPRGSLKKIIWGNNPNVMGQNFAKWCFWNDQFFYLG